MTDLKTQRPYVPGGRPVRRFVVVLVVLAFLFGALWWSGLAAPRLGLGGGSGGIYNAVSGRATARLGLHNRGPLAIEVRRVRLGDGVRVTSVRVNGRTIPTGGRKVAGGGTATIDLEFTCRRTHQLGPQIPGSSRVGLEVTVRTPIGIDRTSVPGSVELSPACHG